jgi:hypothetical protein
VPIRQSFSAGAPNFGTRRIARPTAGALESGMRRQNTLWKRPRGLQGRVISLAGKPWPPRLLGTNLALPRGVDIPADEPSGARGQGIQSTGRDHKADGVVSRWWPSELQTARGAGKKAAVG